MQLLKSSLLLAAIPPLAFGQTYSLTEIGGRNTLDWRIWLKIDGKPASFWHDVPTYPDPSNTSIVNFVVEIPRWEDAKIEIRRDEPLNPIFHDSNDDGVRFVESLWPHKSYPFLYGSIPQTWETPNLNHSFTGFPGDNDPVDAFDVGQDTGSVGQIKQVKILGGLAVVDDGETDWKLLVIDVYDSLAPLVNSVEDLDLHRPGLAESYRQWFRTYKVPRGDNILPISGNDYQDASFTASIVAESHRWWQELVRGEVYSNRINFSQTSMPNATNSYIDAASTYERLEMPRYSTFGEAARKPEVYTHWYYVNADGGSFDSRK